MAELAQLQTWLTEAETALHKLQTGTRVVDVTHEDTRTRYQEADIAKLEKYISSLKMQISVAQGNPARRPIWLLG